MNSENNQRAPFPAERKPRQKPPSGGKEQIGYFIYRVIAPLGSAFLVWKGISESEFDPLVAIPVGAIAWYFWFRPISVYLLAPIWNSLYKPCPNSPTNNGTAICSVYKSKKTNDVFFRGLGGEYLPFETRCPIALDDMVSYCREHRFNRKNLYKIGRVEVEYVFKSYRHNVHHMNPYFRTGPIDYKIPIYCYMVIGKILSGEETRAVGEV